MYGFINIPSGIIFELIEHPYVQRLRRIKQLGMTHLVYPGALHTRFHHALGALHLMTQAIEVLRSKGHTITDEESEAVSIAILLHDIGHSPFSHALEKTLIDQVSHEELSLLFMERLNQEFNGRLSLAIKIFKNEYTKKFLHQLVSSQLDMDRLDYLNRDSFYTGVSEGVISSERIIKMLELHNDELVVEAKGIYSVEKFIIARRLMYWQVYLHKTVIAAEQMLINILKRAKELALNGDKLFATPAFKFFLENVISKKSLVSDENFISGYIALDDSDISASVKVWAQHTDKVLSWLCQCLVNRKLYKVVLQKEEFSSEVIDKLKVKAKQYFSIPDEDADYFVFSRSIVNNAYSVHNEQINILFKDGNVTDISKAADQLNISVLSTPVTKNYLCFAKELIQN